MHKKLVTLTLVVFLTSLVLMPTSLSIDEEGPCSDKFSTWLHKQKVEIPYDTSLEETHFKPVDIKIKFENPCWAKDIKQHSIRVAYQNKGFCKELESQIYDLEYANENIIKSCSLVFLIPENADGSEEYYIYYDSNEKDEVNFIDHVSVEESYYRYEPVQGIFFESWYYLIRQDGSIIYTVSQKGKALSESVSQQVMKIKSGTESIKTNSGEQTISFNFNYWWLKNSDWYMISSSEKLISKKIIYDGNLMVKFLIISQSNDGSIQSTVFYTYYYSPREDTSIYTNVKHEILKHPLPTGEEIDTSFFIFNCASIKSSKFNELNFGTIPEYMHFYSQDERVIPRKLDQNPEGVDWQMVISKQDDCDLGSAAWVSLDHGETGNAYGIIFDSTDVVESGDDERNGIEMQMYQANNIDVPGIDCRSVYIYLMRNHFEKNEELDNELPSNYVVSFNAEFFSTKNGGFKSVEKESNLYKSFVDYQPENNNGSEDSLEIIPEEYTITVYTHFTPTSLLKIIGSKLLLKNTYVKVELYKDGVLRGFVRSGRIGLTQDYWIDWKNTSFFKKAVFPNQNPGTYVVRIYIEDLYLKEREFVGYSIIDLKENKTVHILCKSECKVNLNVVNQQGNGVENIELEILNQNVTILKTSSDSNGDIYFGLPCCLSEGYTLKLFYKGFLLTKEEIKFRLYNLFITYKKNFNFSFYDFTVDIKDSAGEVIDFDFDISLTSKDMINKIYIKPDKTSNDVYVFENLPSSKYSFILKYDLLEFEEKISIPDQRTKNIILYEVTFNLEDLWGLAPSADLDIVLTCEDFEKPVTVLGSLISNEKCVFPHLYPGNYTLKIYYNTYVFEQIFKIPTQNNLNETIIFPVSFNISTKFYDLQGNIFSNGYVVLTKDSKNKTIDIDSNGNAFFAVPPGRYNLSVFDGENLIVKRKIDVLSDKNFEIVTNSFSSGIFIYIIFLIVFFIGFCLIAFKKKSYLHLLKIIVVFLALTSIILPWWSINCNVNEPQVQSSTNFYINNAKLITFTKTDNVFAGYFSTSNDTLISAINIVYSLVCIGIFLFVLGFVLKYLLKKKILSLILTSLAVITFISSVVVFYYTMSEFANATVGSLNGSGVLDVDIIGENIYKQISCSWGLSSGFIVIFLVFLLSFVSIFVEKKKK